MVPYDVLVDPQSLPNHPVLNEKKDMIEIAHKNSIAKAEKKKLEANSDSQVQHSDSISHQLIIYEKQRSSDVDQFPLY